MKKVIIASVATVILTAALTTWAEEREIPQRLQILLNSYESEKERVLKPIEQKFEVALIDLKNQYTKSGRLEDAIAVSNLLATRKEGNKPLLDTRWSWASGGELMLNGDGTATHTLWRNYGFWEKQDDGSIRLLSDEGSYIIKFSDEKNAAVTALRGGATTIRKIE
jgi:hypothetical protein